MPRPLSCPLSRAPPRSTQRTTTGQRVSLNSVEAAAAETRDDGTTYFLYEHVSQVGVSSVVRTFVLFVQVDYGGQASRCVCCMCRRRWGRCGRAEAWLRAVGGAAPPALVLVLRPAPRRSAFLACHVLRSTGGAPAWRRCRAPPRCARCSRRPTVTRWRSLVRCLGGPAWQCGARLAVGAACRTGARRLLLPAS